MADAPDGLMAGGTAPAAPATLEPSAVPHDVAEALVAAGRRMDQRGWVPATSGNLSVRMAAERMAITRSGVHKGFLAIRDIIAVDFQGHSLTPGMKPSAEALLHCQIYRLWPEAGAVLHGHSVAATALTLALPDVGSIDFEGYEIVKAWSAFATHAKRRRCSSWTTTRICTGSRTGLRRCWRRARPRSAMFCGATASMSGARM